MIILLIIIAIVVAIFALLEDYIEEYKWYIYAAIGIVLIILPTTKTLGFDHDSLNYQNAFTYYDDPLYELSYEFSYLWISKYVNLLTTDVHTVFFIYAMLGVIIKMHAMRLFGTSLFLALMVYISNHYLVMELTQIRAGVAAAFFLLAIYYIIQQKKVLAFTLILCATFFHYSSVILFFILFLNNKELSTYTKYILIGGIPLCYILYFMNFNPLTTIPIPYISSKLEIYTSLTESGITDMDQINVFNLVFLVKILIFIYLTFFYEVINESGKNISLLLKIEALSIYSFILFASIPAIAFRISDLLGIVDILLFPHIYYTIKQTIPAKLIVVTIAFAFLLINIFYIKLFEI